MSYFDHRHPQQPYQQTFRHAPASPADEPVVAYPVDEDGDRLYAEEDYAMAPDGDAFLPDEADESALYAEPAYAAAPGVFPYAAGADAAMADDAWDDGGAEMLTDEEREELRRNNWRLLATLADFGGVILGTAFILVLIALLVSLMNWLINDISQTFTLLQMPV